MLRGQPARGEIHSPHPGRSGMDAKPQGKGWLFELFAKIGKLLFQTGHSLLQAPELLFQLDYPQIVRRRPATGAAKVSQPSFSPASRWT